MISSFFFFLLLCFFPVKLKSMTTVEVITLRLRNYGIARLGELLVGRMSRIQVCESYTVLQFTQDERSTRPPSSTSRRLSWIPPDRARSKRAPLGARATSDSDGESGSREPRRIEARLMSEWEERRNTREEDVR